MSKACSASYFVGAAPGPVHPAAPQRLGEDLKELLNAGRNGVCDKKVPADLPEMLAATDRCMQEIEQARRRPPADHLSGRDLLRTLRELFREWNRRLESQE